MPVIMTIQFYAKNSLRYQYANFVYTNDVDNKAAAWYGFARFGLGRKWKYGSKLKHVLLDACQLVAIA